MRASGGRGARAPRQAASRSKAWVIGLSELSGDQQDLAEGTSKAQNAY